MWGTARDANENQSHYRPQMRMILIYALAKRDPIRLYGRALVLAFGALAVL